MNRNNLILYGTIGLITLILILIISYYSFFNSGIPGGGIVNPEDLKYGFEVETLVENLDTPWAIDFLPSRKMIFTERGGQVSVYDLVSKEKTIVREIDEVSEVQESGLSGIAVDPDFANDLTNNFYVYVYYTYDNGNRVSRFHLENEQMVNEEILLDGIPSARFHDGGRIKFGPDGKLYITTGDATNPSSAQDLTTVAGKILRLNSDGSIPEDNPFIELASLVGAPGIKTEIWSYGHRNPQGLAWNSNGELFSSEHGPTRNDEVNDIKPGANYGWPLFECVDESDFGEEINQPVRCFDEFTLAPSGMDFYQGDLYVAGLKGNQIRKFVFDENYQSVIEEEKLFEELGRLREVVFHDGWLYIATSNKDGRGNPRLGDDKILRIRKVVE